MLADRSLQVAVLVGGPSSEHYLSQLSGQTIFKNANIGRYTCTLLNWSQDGWVDESVPGQPEQVVKRHANIFAAFAEPKRFDIVLNMLVSKKIVRAAGFLTPDWFAFSREDIASGKLNIAEKALAFGYPLVVKAAIGGASTSTALVDSEAELHAAIDTLSSAYDEFFLERFLNGLEYTVAVFGDARKKESITLPVARIAYKGRMFDSATKKGELYDVVIPSGLGASDELKLCQMAEQIHADFRFTAFSRVDFRFFEGEPYFLEVNTHPGFGKRSLVPLLLNAGGIALETAIDWLIETGLSQSASRAAAK